MAKREAALSGGDGGIVSIATCKDLGHKRIEVSVVASESEAIERIRSPDTFVWVIARGFSLVAINRHRIPNSLSVIASIHSDSGLCHCGRDIVFPRKAYKPAFIVLAKRAHIECAKFEPKCSLFFAIS